MGCAVNMGNNKNSDFSQNNEHAVDTTRKIRKIGIKITIRSEKCR